MEILTKIPIGFDLYLAAVRDGNEASEEFSGITVGIYDGKQDAWIQDLADIQKEFDASSGSLLDAFSVFVYADENNEDFTDGFFGIGIRDEYADRKSGSDAAAFFSSDEWQRSYYFTDSKSINSEVLYCVIMARYSYAINGAAGEFGENACRYVFRHPESAEELLPGEVLEDPVVIYCLSHKNQPIPYAA